MRAVDARHFGMIRPTHVEAFVLVRKGRRRQGIVDREQSLRKQAHDALVRNGGKDSVFAG